MKTLLYIATITVLTLASCKKYYSAPSVTADNRQTISTLVLATNGISFNLKDQVVKTKLSNNTLTLTYYEDMALVLRSDSLQKAWSVIFKEDFSTTELNKFNYYAINKDGSTSTNYRESNLNNLAITKKDTLVSNVPMTRVSFTRTLIFTKAYTSATEALNEYTFLLSAKETIAFSVFYVFNGYNSSLYSDKSNLTYVAE